jgi:hypothetical protein
MKKVYGISILSVTLAILFTGCTMDAVKQVETPTIRVEPVPNGTLQHRIIIDCTTYEADIFYTNNGSTPTANSAKYLVPLTITASTTYKVFAMREHMIDSEVLEYTVSIPTPVATPVATPVPGPTAIANTYASAQSVYLSSTVDAAIYYTLDGTEPTTSSNLYTGPITITTTTTLKAFAVKSGMPDSAVLTATYTIQ